MSNVGEFQNKVNSMLGNDFNFQLDRAHGVKPVHVDLTVKLPTIEGSDKVSVDFDGNVLGGSTSVGKTKINW